MRLPPALQVRLGPTHAATSHITRVWTYRYVGSKWGTAVLLSETGDSGHDEGAQLDLDQGGNAMAVWNRYGGGLFASRCDAAGNMSRQACNCPPTAHYCQMDCDRAFQACTDRCAGR